MKFAVVAATVAAAAAANYGVSPGIGNACPANSQLKSGSSTFTTMNDCQCDKGWKAYAYPGWGCYKPQKFWECPSHSTQVNYGGSSFTENCQCETGYAADDGSCVPAYIFNLHGRVWLQFQDDTSNNTFTVAEFNDFKAAVATAINSYSGNDDVNSSTVLPYSIHKAVSVEDDISSTKLDHAGMIVAEGESTVRASFAATDGISIGFAIKLHEDNMKTANDIANTMKRTSVIDQLKQDLNAASFSNKIESCHMFVWALSARFWHPDASKDVNEECTHDWQCRPWQKDSATRLGTKCVSKPHTNEKWCRPHYSWAMRNDTKTHYSTTNNLGSPTLQPTAAPGSNATEQRHRADIHIGIKFHCQFPVFRAVHNVTAQMENNVSFGVASRYEYTKQQQVASLIGLAEALAVDPNSMSIRASQDDTDPWNEVYSPSHLLLETKTAMLDSIYAEASKNLTDIERERLINQYNTTANRQIVDHHIDEFLDFINANKMKEAKEWMDARKAEPSIQWPGVEAHFTVKAYSFQEAEAIHDKFTASDFATTLAGTMATEGFPVAADCMTPLAEEIEIVPIQHAVMTGYPTPAPTPARQIPGSRNLCTDGVAMVVVGSARIQYYSKKNSSDAITFMEEMKEAMASAANERFEQGADHGTFQTNDTVAIKGCNIEVTSWTVRMVFVRINPNPHRFGYCACGDNGQITQATWKEMRKDNKIADPTDLAPDSHIFAYDFEFKMNIPGTNMHLGNKIFDFINHDDAEYCGRTNVHTGAGNVVAPKVDENDGLIPLYPTFESVNVSSIELTYVTGFLTKAPTSSPTLSNVDCVLSDWTEWTSCSHSCGGSGTKRRYRMVDTDASGLEGKSCAELYGNQNPSVSDDVSEDGLTETVACATGDYAEIDCPVDCEMDTTWVYETTTVDSQESNVCRGDQGSTSAIKTCVRDAKDHAYTYKTRTVTVAKSGSGKACPQNWDGSNVTNTVGSEQIVRTKCFLSPCPIDCEVTEWSDFSQCTAECKKCKTWNGNICTEYFPVGVQFQHRTIKNVAFYGGAACPALVSDPVECNTQACAVDCQMSEWSDWGSCSQSCANKTAGTRLFGAYQERTRYVIRDGAGGGKACSAEDETQKKLCGLHPCGAHVCTTNVGFPLTCTYEKGIVYTHHVNDVHDNELFMCYHNYVTEVCTCLCWPKTPNANGDAVAGGVDKIRSADVDNFDLTDHDDPRGPGAPNRTSPDKYPQVDTQFGTVPSV
jgi:uncharacterized membrane protein